MEDTCFSFGLPNGGEAFIGPKGATLIDPPDIFPANGIDHIAAYITRLVAPSIGFRSVIISSIDGKRSLGLWARDAEMSAFFTASESGREQAIRDAFAALGSKPVRDFIAPNGPALSPTRYLLYKLEGNSNEITTLTRNLLRDVFAIGPSDPLEISFQS